MKEYEKLMTIAVIDADLIGRNKHRFPNLVTMKISGYHKSKGDTVILKMDYENLDNYDKVYISKVFTDTPCYIDDIISKHNNIYYGGTGFYGSQAPELPSEIEHSKPDYDIYLSFVNEQIASGRKRTEFKEYLDYSIGFLTRGCFRKCGFCVNKKYDKVFKASPLNEFYDPNRKKICLLDDNFLGFENWQESLEELQATGRLFKFKQGLDERILTPKKCELLFSSKYDSEITFAFDWIKDYELIEEKLKLIRKYSNKLIKFYVLCGYDPTGKYDKNFWKEDIIGVFKRIELLAKYNALPYIMRFEKYKDSPYRGMYITLTRWINQPAFFKKQSLEQYIKSDCKYSKTGNCASKRYFDTFLNDAPEIANKYFFHRIWQSDEDEIKD